MECALLSQWKLQCVDCHNDVISIVAVDLMLAAKSMLTAKTVLAFASFLNPFSDPFSCHKLAHS